MAFEGKEINIRMLGEFTISDESGKIAISDRTNRSRKVLNLLQYIICFRERDVSQQELIDILWPDGDSDEPANTLKTLLHRARSAFDELESGLGKLVITSKRGSYSWNNEYKANVDSEFFEKCCQDAAEAAEDEKLRLLIAAVDTYRGDFLPKAAGELWVMPINTYYHNMYLSCVHEASELLADRAQFDEMIRICQQAAAIDPFDEQVHLNMIQALIAAGMQQQAMSHYNQVTEMYLNRFGITPSPQLTALYKDIIKTNKSTEMNLNIIRENLAESEDAQGAFYCEYEFFKDVYRLEARSASRTGGVVQIGLITLMDSYGQKLNQKQVSLTMERLHDVIQTSLRNSDVFTRFSVSQYLVMLPSASLEDGNRVLQRINTNFRRLYPHMNVLFHYSALPMEPKGS